MVRKSFERQVGLFRGEDSPFAGPRAAARGASWLGPMAGDEIVLDVACGAGHVVEEVAPWVRQVVGVDLTRALLTLGAGRLRDRGITNVLLQEGDAAHLPFLDESFDLVCCRAALHHFPDPAGPVAEMARVCRPGGRVVVLDMVATSAAVRDAFDDLHRHVDPSHAGVLLAAELTELVGTTVGPVRSSRTTDPVRFPLDLLLREAAEPDVVVAAVQAELAGGAPTGFDPSLEDDQLRVAFTNAVVDAVRAPT